jgi:organic radical activating enzyme
MQSYADGIPVKYDEIIAKIEKGKDFYSAVVFSGGEPTIQEDSLVILMERVKKLGLERWVYTGEEIDKVSDRVKELASVIVAGRFERDKATGVFPASSNQKVIDKRKTGV